MTALAGGELTWPPVPRQADACIYDSPVSAGSESPGPASPPKRRRPLPPEEPPAPAPTPAPAVNGHPEPEPEPGAGEREGVSAQQPAAAEEMDRREAGTGEWRGNRQPPTQQATLILLTCIAAGTAEISRLLRVTRGTVFQSWALSCGSAQSHLQLSCSCS